MSPGEQKASLPIVFPTEQIARQQHSERGNAHDLTHAIGDRDGRTFDVRDPWNGDRFAERYGGNYFQCVAGKEAVSLLDDGNAVISAFA